MPQAIDQSDPPRDGGASDTTPAGTVRIRHLRTYDDYLSCVELQRKVWGTDFNEIRPAAMFKVAQRIGGVAAGAFDADDRLVGFVFGMTGTEAGELVHWSDMLAVSPDLRDSGIGRMLKEFQHETVRRLGVTRIYWTFDPLVARNAHLNFNRLGVSVAEYVPDMYGGLTTSALHQGLGTDRFIVAWQVTGATGSPRRGRASTQPDAAHDSRVVNAPDSQGVPATPELSIAANESTFRVAIPLEIDKVQATSLANAARWRATTRSALQWGLKHGYRVRSFYCDPATGCGYYVLSNTPLAEET